MRGMILMVVCGLGLSACGGAVNAFEDWGNKACECKDKACAEQMKTEFDRLEDKYRKDIKGFSDEDKKKTDAAYEKGTKCLEAFGVSAG